MKEISEHIEALKKLNNEAVRKKGGDPRRSVSNRDRIDRSPPDRERDRQAMIRGTYIGPNSAMEGETAILRSTPEGHILAQYGNTALARHLTHGWTEHPRSHFKIMVTQLDIDSLLDNAAKNVDDDFFKQGASAIAVDMVMCSADMELCDPESLVDMINDWLRRKGYT